MSVLGMEYADFNKLVSDAGPFGDLSHPDQLGTFDNPGVYLTHITTETHLGGLVFAALAVEGVTTRGRDSTEVSFKQSGVGPENPSIVTEIHPIASGVWRQLVGIELVAGLRPVGVEYGSCTVSVKLNEIIAVEPPLSPAEIFDDKNPGYVQGLVEKVKDNPNGYRARLRLGGEAGVLWVFCDYSSLRAVQLHLLNDGTSDNPRLQKGDLARMRVRKDTSGSVVVPPFSPIHLLDR